MTVHYEIEGPVAVVTIDRPEARNAVDRPTAEALVDAFDALRRRRRARGRGAHRRAGHVLRRRRPQGDVANRAASGSTRVSPDGDGPMGPTRHVARPSR